MALATLPVPLHPDIDAIVWDYDGTLVDTRSADEAAVAELLRRDPAAVSGVELFWATEGQPILGRLELAWPGRLEELGPIFEKPVAPRKFHGITTVIADLRRRGYHLAVVSSRRSELLDWGLAACGLRFAFEVVIGLDDVHEPKPSPEGLLRALRSLGVPPTRAIYVGDSEVDIEAGRRAGMTAWRATWASAHPITSSNHLLLRQPRELLERVATYPDPTRPRSAADWDG